MLFVIKIKSIFKNKNPAQKSKMNSFFFIYIV